MVIEETQADRERFLEMRTRGLSFNKISKEINVSKPILIGLGKGLEMEIGNRRDLEMEALQKRYIM